MLRVLECSQRVAAKAHKFVASWNPDIIFEQFSGEQIGKDECSVIKISNPKSRKQAIKAKDKMESDQSNVILLYPCSSKSICGIIVQNAPCTIPAVLYEKSSAGA